MEVSNNRATFEPNSISKSILDELKGVEQQICQLISAVADRDHPMKDIREQFVVCRKGPTDSRAPDLARTAEPLQLPGVYRLGGDRHQNVHRSGKYDDESRQGVRTLAQLGLPGQLGFQDSSHRNIHVLPEGIVFV